MRTRILSEEGMSLIEAVISITLVVLVVLSILIAVTQNATFSRRIDKVYTSSNLAKKRIDDLKRYNFRDLGERAVEAAVRVDAEGSLDLSGDYVRTTEITEDYAGNPYMTRMKVSVDKMIEGSPSGSPVVMETIFADVE